MKFSILFFAQLIIFSLVACQSTKGSDHEGEDKDSVLKDYIRKPIAAAGASKTLAEDREKKVKAQFEDMGQ